MKQPTNPEILAALEQSGYLFEQQVADRFEALGYHVDTSWAFPDGQQEKSREIGVRAIRRVMADEKHKIHFFVEFLVECKAFEAPLVFLTRPKNQRELLQANPSEYIFPLRHYNKKLDANSHTEVPPFIHLELRKHHYYYKDPRKATQFAKIVQRKGDSWTANHDGVYDGLILPLAKALAYRRADVDRTAHSAHWKSVWLLFPVVVLAERLLTLDLAAAHKNLQSCNRVSFVRHLQSGELQGHFLTDFVTYKGLNEYVEDDVSPFVRTIEKMIATDPQRLLNRSA